MIFKIKRDERLFEKREISKNLICYFPFLLCYHLFEFEIEIEDLSPMLLFFKNKSIKKLNNQSINRRL